MERSITDREKTYLSFFVLILLRFLVLTIAQDDPPYKEIPGGITTNPTDRILLQVMDKKSLRIGVPRQFDQNGVFQVKHDDQTNTTNISGFCGDVFETAFAALGIDFQLILFADEQRDYSNLIYQVYTGEFDAVVGDITITANRSQYVDFTLPYTDLGLGMLSKNADETIWIFLRPLSSDLWLVSVCFFILLGFVIWILEHRNNEEFQGSRSEQIGITLWFAFSTLFYAHRQNLQSNLSRFVVTVWLFVVFVIAASYTATLSSLLTIEQIRSTSKGESIGYNYGSFMVGNIITNLNFKDASLRPYSTSDDFANALSRGAKNGGVDAIIDEIPYLKDFFSLYPSGYSMVVSEMTTSGFGFAFTRGSPLVPELSRKITRLREDGTLKVLENKWFKPNSQLIDSESTSRILNVKAYRGLFLISGASMAVALFIFSICFIHEKVHFNYRMLAGGKLAYIMSILKPNKDG